MEGEGGIERTVETTTGTEIGIEAPAGMTEIETETETSGTVTGVIAAETNLGTDSSENRTMTEGDACRYEMKEREGEGDTRRGRRSCVLVLLPCSFVRSVFLSCCYCASYVKCSERRCYICPVLSCLLPPVRIRIHAHHFPAIFRGGKKASLSNNQTIRRRACVSVAHLSSHALASSGSGRMHVYSILIMTEINPK